MKIENNLHVAQPSVHSFMAPRSVRICSQCVCIRPKTDIQLSCNNSSTRLVSMFPTCVPSAQTCPTVNFAASPTHIHKRNVRLQAHRRLSMVPGSHETLTRGFAPGGLASSQALQQSNLAAANTCSLAPFPSHWEDDHSCEEAFVSTTQVSVSRWQGGKDCLIMFTRILDFRGQGSCQRSLLQNVLYQIPSLHLEDMLHRTATEFHKLNVSVCFFRPSVLGVTTATHGSRFCEDSRRWS